MILRSRLQYFWTTRELTWMASVVRSNRTLEEILVFSQATDGYLQMLHQSQRARLRLIVAVLQAKKLSIRMPERLSLRPTNQQELPKHQALLFHGCGRIAELLVFRGVGDVDGKFLCEMHQNVADQCHA